MATLINIGNNIKVNPKFISYFEGLEIVLANKHRFTVTADVIELVKAYVENRNTGALHYKGNVSSVSNLPSTGNVDGDMYLVTGEDKYYAWNGTSWAEQVTIVNISSLESSLASEVSRAQDKEAALEGKVDELDTQINGHVYLDYEATSSESSTVNVVPVNTPVNVKKGTKVRMTLDGFGTLVRSYRYYINGSSTHEETVSKKVYEVEFDEDITKFRVAVLSSQTIGIGELHFTMESVGIATLVPKVSELADNVSLETLQKVSETTGYDFTQSFSFYVNLNRQNNTNLIFSALAKYVNNVDDEKPTIQFFYGEDATNVIAYIVGEKDNFSYKNWRLYAPIDGDTIVKVVISIPSNVTLSIKSFGCSLSNEITRDTSFKMFAHTFKWGNFNTRLAFEMSAKCGFYGAVAVPKRTADGVWVCFHDDSNIGSMLKYNDGSSVTYNRINDATYSDVQRMVYKNANLIGENQSVPTLEEFFLICAKTGMHPMLSCHPDPTQSDWEEIKEIAFRCGVLDCLNIKSAGTNVDKFNTCYNVFGDDIESYMGDVSTLGTTALVDRLNSWDNAGWTKSKFGIELYPSLATESNIAEIIEHGYKVGIYQDYPSAEFMKSLMSLGVTEWTLANNFSNGLNW